MKSRKASGFSLFTKEHYGAVKAELLSGGARDTSHKAVMGKLSEMWKKRENGSASASVSACAVRANINMNGLRSPLLACSPNQ